MKRLFISLAILLAATTFVMPSLLSAASTVSVTPVLRASEHMKLTSTLSVAGTTGVTWSLSPQIGSVTTGGVYTAPTAITSVQTVLVTATSVSDTTQSGFVAITLRPTVTLSVSPGQATIFTSQTQQCTTTLTGATDSSVLWSINPAVGSISASGLYTAPSTLGSPQTVTVTATSVADPDSSAITNITVNPVVAVSLSPGSAQLFASQSQQFTATLTGTTNTAVTWSLAPSVGTVANGLYTAPATINSPQRITVTATSAADPTKSATATINLVPVVAVTVTPTSASLSGGQSTQFNATVTGTANTAVAWTLAPAMGTVTNGLYTAPAAISSPQTVTLTATSAADPTKMAQASIALMPPQAITMPIEVTGPIGNTQSVTVPIPPGTNLSGVKLWMQIHGLRYADKASVQVNNAPWVPIDDNTVTVLGLGRAYGGVGGGFATLKMTLDLPDGVLAPGNNTVSFQFTGTQGGIGFRVLRFNFVEPDGTMLLPASLFVDDDPNTWQPPLTSASDIAEGKLLFQTASILHKGVPVPEHCNGCHTQDGRDFKYFNYSNRFIHYAAVHSGLTDHQGDQIASYLRTLNVPNPGRPWNPPYQPGPGLDSKPVEEWAAGAGIDAVLDSDSALLSELFPTGVQPTFFDPNNNLNTRETPLPMQLLDWNHWLPEIHPMDAWPDFLASKIYTLYGTLRAGLQPGSAAAYVNAKGTLDSWDGDYFAFIVSKTNNLPATTWTPTYVSQVHSIAQWAMVKHWEINHEFGLEGMARTVFLNPKADSRAWRTQVPFLASPNMLHIPRGAAGLDNGKPETWSYLSCAWYQAQLVIDNGEYELHGATPIDWGYTYAKLNDLSKFDSPPQAALYTLWLAKAFQLSNNGFGPDKNWRWLVTDVSRLTTPAFRQLWLQIPAATRTAIFQGFVNEWLTEVQGFQPSQFWNSLTGINSTQVPAHFAPDSPLFVDRVWAMIPRFRYFGVNQAQINQMAAWAKTIWPAVDWTPLTTATCGPEPLPGDQTVIVCNTDK